MTTMGSTKPSLVACHSASDSRIRAAAEVGKRGQMLMRSRYSPKRMAQEVKRHLQRIGAKLEDQQKEEL